MRARSIAASFSPDGRRVVTGFQRTRRRGCGTPKAVSRWASQCAMRAAVVAASFSPDGRRVVTGSGQDGAGVGRESGSRWASQCAMRAGLRPV